MALKRNQRNTSVTGASTPICPGQMGRIAIIIGCPKVARVWISFTGPAAVGTGLCLHPGQLPLVLAEQWMAEAFVEEITAVSEGAAEIIGVVEIFT